MKEKTYFEKGLASRFERFIARFLDRLFAISLGVLLFVVLGRIPLFNLAIKIGCVLVPVLYLFFKDAFPFLNGQSLGKKALGIQAIDHRTGMAITGQYGKSFVREIVQWIPGLNLVDGLLIFSGDTYQRLADRMVDTQVVKL